MSQTESHTEVVEHHFHEKGIIARQTGQTGSGIFATVEFKPGDVIYKMDFTDNQRAHMTPYADAFGDCYDRGITVIPGFVFCTTVNHPLWHTNHSCDANGGFVNWGRIENEAMLFVAYRAIHPGEQITIDYSLITPYYDGSLAGDPWLMTQCLCEQPNCRDTITDFRELTPVLQQQAVLLPGDPHGPVIAHILNDEPHLVEMLKTAYPQHYTEFRGALQQQQALSARLLQMHKG